MCCAFLNPLFGLLLMPSPPRRQGQDKKFFVLPLDEVAGDPIL